MFCGECTCEFCGRVYRYDYRKGHTKKQCNSCRTNRLRFVHRRKERLVGLLGGACELCGYSRCLQSLTFHHLDPATKRFNIASGASRSWASLRDEARKCVLLCHNCHHEVENGITTVPLDIQRRIRRWLRGVERIEPRRPGRPELNAR